MLDVPFVRLPLQGARWPIDQRRVPGEEHAPRNAWLTFSGQTQTAGAIF
jgi:hypothetical protein